MKKDRGFTLVEVMVAITIIILALFPIFGSMVAVLRYHRALLDREIAIGLSRSIENILDSQEDFYTYNDSGEAVTIRSIWELGKEYPIILHKDSAGVASASDYIISIPTNSKIFVARAYAMKNPDICDDIPSTNSCSQFGENPYIYAVKIVITWNDGVSIRSFSVSRRFYKP